MQAGSFRIYKELSNQVGHLTIIIAITKQILFPPCHAVKLLQKPLGFYCCKKQFWIVRRTDV